MFGLLFSLHVVQLAWRWVDATDYACDPTATCGCSQIDVQMSSRLISGEPSRKHSWGWAVSLSFENNFHLCAGAILAEQYIITAAHCVHDNEFQNHRIYAALGTDRLVDGDGQRVLVAQAFVHPRWNRDTSENDIALLRLNASIDFDDPRVARTCLPWMTSFNATKFPAPASSLVAINWKATWESRPGSSDLLQAAVEVFSRVPAACEYRMANGTLQFGVTVVDDDTGTYTSDSGGPVMYYSEKYRQWMIAGITSAVVRCNDGKYIGIYTRIAVYLGWIRSVVVHGGVIVLEDSEPVVLTDNLMMTLADAGEVHRPLSALFFAEVVCLMFLGLW